MYRLFSIICVLVIISSCKSVPVRQDVLHKFMDIMDRSESLSKKAVKDSRAYASIQRGLERILKAHPELKENNKARERAISFISKYPPFKCTVKVKEPGGAFYTSSGLELPVDLDFSGDLKDTLPPFRIRVSGTGRLLLNNKKNSVYLPGAFEPVFYRQVRITQASFEGKHNVIHFEGRYYAHPVISVLSKNFGHNEEAWKISFSPSYHKVTKVPRAQHQQYEILEEEVQDITFLEASTGDETGTVKVFMDSKGRFSAVSQSDKTRPLLYSGIKKKVFTSHGAFHVNGQSYRLDRLMGRVRRSQKGAVEYTVKIAALQSDALLRLTPIIRGKGHFIKCELEIANKSRRAASVGGFLYLDTMAGYSDVLPFATTSGDTESSFTSERTIKCSTVNIWQTGHLENDSASAVELINILKGEGLTPPDTVTFSPWRRSRKAPFTYSASSRRSAGKRRVTGDSAVALKWNPIRIAPGTSRKMSTYLAVLTDTSLPVVIPPAGGGSSHFIYLSYVNDSDKEKKVTYLFRLRKGELKTSTGEGFTMRVPPGKKGIKLINASLLSPEDTELIISMREGKNEKTYKYPVMATAHWNRVSSSPIQKREIPVQYFSKKEMDLKARGRTPSGRFLGTINLEKEKWQKGFMYRGHFKIPARYKGRVIIEVIK